jgi:hypothetical protein
VSRNRLPSQTNLWDGWGEGFGAWGLVAYAKPAGCWSWLRPRCVSAPHGTVPVSCWRWLRGHLRGAGAISGHPCGGTETGPNRADARRSLKATIHRLELAPHVWRLRAETPGTANTRRYNRREKDSSPINQIVPDRRPSRLSPAGGIQSSCRGCGPWAWASRECHD